MRGQVVAPFAIDSLAMPRFPNLPLVVLLWCGFCCITTAAEIDFDQHVAALIARRCLQCHRGEEAEAKLDLSRHERVLTGGESGPALVPGNLEDSLIWQRVSAGEMPQDNPLPADERKLLRQWIVGGALWGSNPIDPFLSLMTSFLS